MDNSEREWFVYALTDPRDDQVRYVGWTGNLKLRLYQHIYYSATEKTYKAHWISQLTGLGLTPGYIVLESGTGEGYKEAEIKWINHYKDSGCRLTNLTNGGDGTNGYVQTEEAKEHLRRLNTGKKQSKETIEKRVQKLTGQKRTPEMRERMSALQKGRTLSEESRQKLKNRPKGIRNTEEQKQKISASLKGRIKSEETRRRLSVALTGRKMSVEAVEKMRQTKIGLRCSDETKQKMSQSSPRCVSVRCIETGIVYRSISEAARSFNSKPGRLWQALRNKTKMYGYSWERVS